MTRPVFLADEREGTADRTAGDRVRLDGDEGRHAAQVRRIRVGEEVDVVDGEGTRLTCRVEGADKQGLDLLVLDRVDEGAPSPGIVLVQALAKGGRDEQAVDVCTQIGVDEVVPWQSTRAIVKWEGQRAAKGRAKWEAVARASAKQARRARVPRVREAVDSRGLAGLVADCVDGGGLALVCHEEATGSLTRFLADTPIGPDCPRVLLVVGPEGGIAPEEVEALTGAGARLIGLGPTVLRSSTAGAVALTLVVAAAGRM
ncbi:16S rRNA (uracil(1498)-N(3))-methyltransferase [Actinomyces sp. B33]|uniref:16S rRNA (uracil(1498)-N(3))-methyltransferase n=1 Tax=Actinomyces sp. B33 TaxID=2942131 RepID=UPI00233FE980|nr:16S rRNA (uracil(1498)-N(3))-methyltransferase [Actinomyces sp. B33]MDC4232831.1 16S rRNA (uracil(1498)-N(3))-methyltransferase [Actinomyces sp. B33]